MLTRKTLLLVASATVALAGCWDNDDEEVTTTPPTPPVVATAVPDSAVASSMALVTYVKGLSTTDETTEALTLPTIAAFTSETEEPQTL